MTNILTSCFSTAAGGMLGLGVTPAKFYTEATLDDYHQELVTSCAKTGKAPCCSVSPAPSTWPVVLSISLLCAARHDPTMWHSRCLETLSMNTLLRLRAVNRTCPRNSKGSAGTPQGNPGSSNVLLQPPSAFTPAADSPHAGSRGKRRGDDDGNNSRKKRSKKAPGGSPKKKVLCPFKVKHPDNPSFENCGAHEWTRLTEHIRYRKHRPRDRCQRCGLDFFEDVEWADHTSICNEVPSRQFGSPICIERNMLPQIADLTHRGRRSRPIEELYVKLWAILFGNDPPAPHSRLWLRITHGQTAEDLSTNHRLQDDQETLDETHRTVNNVPNHGLLQPLQDYNESYFQVINEQTGIDRSHEPPTGEASLVEQFRNHGLQNRAPTPPAPPGEEQMPRNSEGQLEHSRDSPSNFSSWGPGTQSLQSSLHPSQPLQGFPSVSQQLEPGYVNLYQLNAQPFQPHVLNNSSSSAPTYPTSTAPSSDSIWMSDWNTSNLPYTLPEDSNNLHNGLMPVGSHDPVLLDENELDLQDFLGNNFSGS